MYVGFTKESQGELKVKMYTNVRVQLSVHFGLCPRPCTSGRSYIGGVSSASGKVHTLFSYTPTLVNGSLRPVAKYVSYPKLTDASVAMEALEAAPLVTRGAFIESVVLTPAEPWYRVSLQAAPLAPGVPDTNEPDCLYVLGVGCLLRGKEYVNWQLANYIWNVFMKQDPNHEYPQWWWLLYDPSGKMVSGSSIGYDSKIECLDDMRASGYEDGFDITKGE